VMIKLFSIGFLVLILLIPDVGTAISRKRRDHGSLRQMVG
jgi:hypothetical protein